VRSGSPKGERTATKDGRHVGGSADSRTDVMSFKAQRLHGFRVVGLPWDSEYVYDCLKDPSSPVWKTVVVRCDNWKMSGSSSFVPDGGTM